MTDGKKTKTEDNNRQKQKKQITAKVRNNVWNRQESQNRKLRLERREERAK